VIIISHNSKHDDLIKGIAQNNNIPISQVSRIISEYLKNTSNDITDGEITTIPHIGTFQKQEIKPRRFYNLNTGEYQTSSGYYGVKFTPKKNLLKIMNERNEFTK
jgi:nucleoid DNA-binding protein